MLKISWLALTAMLFLLPVIVLLPGGGSASAQVNIQNGSFEMGDTTGWVASQPGLTAVVNSCSATCSGSPFAPYNPVDGSFFALMTAGGGTGVFSSLSQTLTVHAGDVITGWSFFCDAETNGCGGETGDAGYCDLAQAQVTVAAGLPQTVFSADACSGDSTNWTKWTFTVPGTQCAPVDVTIFAGVANERDNSVPGRMGLDDVQIDDSACPTPTPTSTSTVVPTATPRRVNVGGAVGAVVVAAAQQAHENQAAAQATPALPAQVTAPKTGTGVSIAPPNTGDGGLVSDAGNGAARVVLLVMFGFVLTLVTLRRPRQRRH